MPSAIDIPADQFVTLDGIRFHYLDWGGDGEPLLLLAGLGCTAPLAIYAIGDQWQGADATWRAACRERFAAETGIGQVMEIRASHYLFFDRRADVLAAMRDFLP